MKQITIKTILKQGDKIYQPIESNKIIYWVDGVVASSGIVAQSKSGIFKKTPVIDLYNYIEKLAEDFSKQYTDSHNYIRPFIKGYKANKNQYTQKDIENAIKLGKLKEELESGVFIKKYTNKQILEILNSISIIEVDEQFNIINYE
jgi:hypothetical protein